MSWHYQIRKQIDMDGDSWYDIVEVYGKPFGHTIDGMTPGSETRAGLIEVLEMMLKDAKRYRVIYDKKAPLDGADVNFGQHPFVYDPPSGYTPALKGVEVLTQPCLFHNVNPQANPVMGLACPCPRCSPR